MKITFPYMGTSHIAFKYLIESLGHQAIVPPKPSKRTLSLGTQHSPEFACLPFKLLMGNYLEAIEQGAELIITSGGIGPCRAGYYGVLHQKLLEDMGYPTRMLVFESPFRYPLDFFKKVKAVLAPNKIGWLEFLGHYKRAWRKLQILDEVEAATYDLRPFEVHKGETTKIFNHCLTLIDDAAARDEMEQVREESLVLLRGIALDRSRKPLKIGIIGEIYVVLEPFANFDLQVTLGEMGVITQRTIYLAGWAKENSSWDGEKEVKEAAKPYLKEMIGGHGINSVGDTVHYARRGFHGVVQLAPFTCIPEIVAKGILNKVSQDMAIPVMTVFLDEQTGKAGVQTRLEAFVDLLAQKRERMEEMAI
ncbi:MAG: CoA protein activase [Clostridia bacterium]|nr:CoA protein activase [Clostridia bacterium]